MWTLSRESIFFIIICSVDVLVPILIKLSIRQNDKDGLNSARIASLKNFHAQVVPMSLIWRILSENTFLMLLFTCKTLEKHFGFKWY